MDEVATSNTKICAVVNFKKSQGTGGREVFETREEVAQLQKAKDEIAKLTSHEVIEARQEMISLKKQLEEAKNDIAKLIQREVAKFRIHWISETG